jgi:hypothetical protein
MLKTLEDTVVVEDWVSEFYDDDGLSVEQLAWLREVKFDVFPFDSNAVQENLQDILDALLYIQELAFSSGQAFGQIKQTTDDPVLASLSELISDEAYVLYACLEEINDPTEAPADNAKYVVGELKTVDHYFCVFSHLLTLCEPMILPTPFESLSLEEQGLYFDFEPKADHAFQPKEALAVLINLTCVIDGMFDYCRQWTRI